MGGVGMKRIVLRNLLLSIQPRMAVAAACGMVCLCAVAAPILLARSHGTAASVLYLLFSRICHQMPERSFSLLGYPLAVCHRCMGIYAGLFLGCFLNMDVMNRSPRTRRGWILSAVLLLACDALAPAAGLWTNTWCTRFFSGLFFGTLASSLVMRGLSELAEDASLRPLLLASPQPKGDLV